MLTNEVMEVTQLRDLKARLPVRDDSSEITELTLRFNELLSTIDNYQDQIAEGQKMRAEVRLSKQVAHDIRSPLSALQILAGTAKNVDSEWKDLLLNSCQRIQKIADNLVVKDKNGDDVNLTQILIHTVHEKKLLHKHLRLILNFDPECTTPVVVRADSSILGRIFSNLINNAVEAGGSSGEININVGRVDGLIKVTLQDNGPGFDNHVLKYAGLQEISLKGNGRGLGLSGVSESVRDWGGNIHFSNLAKGGARIELYLRSSALFL